MRLSGLARQPSPREYESSGLYVLYFIIEPDLLLASSGASLMSGSLVSDYSRTGSVFIQADVPNHHVWRRYIGQAQLGRNKTSTNSSKAQTTNIQGR